MKLSEAQRRCLTWYLDAENDPRRVVPAKCGWNMRQVNRLLEIGMLHVGPGGWHVPSPAGRPALARKEAENG